MNDPAVSGAESVTPATRALVEALVEQRMADLERTRSARLRRRALVVLPLLALPFIAAHTPSTGMGAIESRLHALESIISIAPDGAAQARGPFQVTDATGKVLFAVGPRPVANAVSVTPSGTAQSMLRLVGSRGEDAASLLVDPDGTGRVSNFDASGDIVAQFNSAGLNVFASGNASPVAGVTRGQGVGRVAVWKAGKVAVELTADAQGNGRAITRLADGKESAAMGAMRPDLTGLAVFHNGTNVVSILSRNGRGVVGVSRNSDPNLTAEMTVDSSGGGIVHMKGADGKVAIGLYGRTRTIALGNPAGKTVAEMTVHPNGTGLFQIWDGGSTPLAVLGKSVERNAGILQISNGASIIHSLTADGSGDGYWQLSNRAGTPMLEADVQDNGLGTIRAGPLFRCVHRMTGGIQTLPDCIRGRNTP